MQSVLRNFFYHHDGLKQFIEAILIRFGYCVVPSNTGFRFVKLRSDQSAYKPIYAPWEGGSDFARLVGSLSGYTTTRPKNLWTIYSLARQTVALGGEVWQVGVFKGGGARVIEQAMADAAAPPATKLRLFDTFEGIAGASPEHDYLRDGPAYDGSENHVHAIMQSGSHVIHKGMVPDTFKPLKSAPISFLHLDVDLFGPTLATLNHANPLMQKGSLILVETYGYATHLGVREAVDIFCAATNRHATVLPTAQAIILF